MVCFCHVRPPVTETNLVCKIYSGLTIYYSMALILCHSL